jgi:hypothetical protein
MECLRLVNTWSISVTEFFGRTTSPGHLASTIAKGRHRAPLREIGHYRRLFVVNPVEPAVPITGGRSREQSYADGRRRQPPYLALQYTHKKDRANWARPVQQGGSNPQKPTWIADHRPCKLTRNG